MRPWLSLPRRLGLARLLASLERLWPHIFALALALGAFVAAAALDLFILMPVWLHRLMLIGLGFAILWTAADLARRYRRANQADAARWLERSGGLAHRPVDALDDRPANLSGLSLALWQRHQARMRAEAEQAKLSLPRLSWIDQDPMALRFAVLLALLIGVGVAGRDLGRRLDDSFTLDPGAAPRAVALDAWITPPDYTGLPPIVLAEEAAQATLPEGSRLTVRLSGGTATPEVRLGEQRFAFETVADTAHAFDRVLPTGGDLQIRQGGAERGTWRLHYRPDLPPRIDFAGEPGLTRRHALQLSYQLSDDYGVTGGALILRRGVGNTMPFGPPSDDAVPDEEAIRVPLAPESLQGETVTRLMTRHLADHYWAGQPVIAQLQAKDALGQVGRSPLLEFTLPERPFNHPVAARLIALRKQLVADPDQRSEVLRELDAVSRRPDAFGGDLTSFAVLRAAYWRLRQLEGPAGHEVAALLWQAALRIEDGQLSLAERNLRDTMAALERALDGDGGDLAQLADQLARDLNALMNAHLGQQMPSQAPPPGSPQGQMQLVDQRMLQSMVEQIRQLAEAGRTEEARHMLSQLQQMMENLRPSPLSPEEIERMVAAAQAADMLQDLEQEQQELLNRTARQTLQNQLLQQLGRDGQSFEGLGEEQEAIAQALKDLEASLKESGLGEAPGTQAAQEAVSEALKALQAEAGGSALDDQARALEALKSAGQSMQQQLAQSRQRMNQGVGRDPLGNPLPNASSGPLDLPDEDQLRRVQEIIETIRERLADPDLPSEERDYLERLLRRY